MFESLVANLLNRFLGSYIENFDPKQLNIGIWSGDVKLKNLRLKKESLDKFKLPIDVKFGHLGELTLQIPWSNLKGKPVRIIIEDVYLLASPIILQDYDEEEDKKRELNLKFDKLDNLETIDQATKQNQSIANDTAANETFTESLITKIIDNLQITIKNIHIRYEDDSILTEVPYSIGLTLNELSAVSTDESWVPSFISITQALTRKLLTLQNLSCYMNTDSTTIYTEDYDDLLNKFKLSLDDNASQALHLQYLLKPVSGNGKITIHKAGTTENFPHIKAELFFKEFGLELDSQQYRDLLWTASKFHWFIKTYKFRKLRPKISIQENPRQWFKFAAESVLNEIHDRNYKWTWESFAKRRDQRKAYIKLYKLKLLNTIKDDQKTELHDLEVELPFEDIKFYRSLTKQEIRKEKSFLPTILASSTSQQPAATDATYVGWVSNWWSGSSATATQPDPKALAEDASEKDPEQLDLSLSEEQKKALYDAIGYDENQEVADAIDVPRDRVKLEILASLEKGGITIKNSKESGNLAEVIFEGCTAQVYQRPDSFLSCFQLQEFRVEDGTGTTLYKHIVSVKQLHSHLHENTTTHGEHDEKDDPFFQISFENNPLDGSADSILLGKLKSMTIFYNAIFIEEIARFFTPPKAHLDTVGAIMNAAEATMEGLTSRTRIGLQYALEEHKTVNVKLDLQAPLIILPLEPSNFKSPVAILDAGHISVVSDLVDKSKIEEIKAKETYTDEDWEQLNTLMYDKFSLHLQDAQFLVGSNIKNTMEQLHNEESERAALMLDKLNIKLLLGISILPDAYNLAKIKIGGEVPQINLAINDFQYKTIMKIIEIAIPNFEPADSEVSSLFNAFGEAAVNDQIEELDNNSSSDDTIVNASDSSLKKVEEVKDTKQLELIKNQHMFEFDFNVGIVHISLSRCIDAHTLRAEALIDLVGENLNLNFYRTVNDMHLDLTLADINLIDHIEKSGIPEFEKLISSNDLGDSSPDTTDKELFKLDYSRNLRIVEFNGKEIEVFDQDIKMDIATVKLVITRKSLLSILNFVLNTFTDPNALATPADELKHNDSTDDEVAPQKINVDINLDRIIMVLNEDGIKLATIQLSTANINVFLVPESMEVTGKLGALTLRDESNHGTGDESLRNLISMDGDNLAEFTYKTFDRETNINVYNSLVEFKTGALSITFVEHSFNRVLSFLSQFLKMKAIYDRARDAAINQANQIDDANKIKFDLLINAPTIIFPTLIETPEYKFNKIISNLGEIYISNQFKQDGTLIKNLVSAGIQKVCLSSEFYFEDDICQVAEIVNNLDISFKIDYSEEYVPGVPTFKILGKMPEIELNVTELQLSYLLKISSSITNAFSIVDEPDGLEEIEEDAENANAVVKHDTILLRGRQASLSLTKNPETIEIPDEHKQVQLLFQAPSFSLNIYNKTAKLENIAVGRLGAFSLKKIRFYFDLMQNTHFSSDLKVESFTIRDIRNGTKSKFPELVPMIDNGEDQFYLGASSYGPPDKKNITVMLTIDSPKTILVLDYLFELSAFFSDAFQTEEPVVNGVDKNLEVDNKSHEIRNDLDAKIAPEVHQPNIGYSINVKNPSVILLADGTNEATEAIVFKVEQILITSQNVLSLAANKIGSYLTVMNDFDNAKYRIIDDFSISFAHDSRGSTATAFLTSIQASIDPMLVRVSLRDIRLALAIFNKATELYSSAQSDSVEDGEESNGLTLSDEFQKKLSQYVPSITSIVSAEVTQKDLESNKPVAVVKGEELNVSIGGMRFVLIGDVHELPVLDMNIKPFEVRAINWSTDLSAEAYIEQFVNIYNYSCSAWEPLIEPWPIAIYATKKLLPKESLSIEIVSREIAEVTVTSRSVALLSQIMSLISSEETLKPRGQDNPYIIINETGYDIEVWPDHDEESRKAKSIIKSYEKLPWAFEDWRIVRENLDTNNNIGVLGFRLLGSKYKDVRNISATEEGEYLIILYPPVNGVHNRISCEIVLGNDNVKSIFIRSTVKIENDSDVAIAVRMIDQASGAERELTIESKKSQSIPIECVYASALKVRPAIVTSYEWSDGSLFWKDLLSQGVSLRCAAMSAHDRSSYYFQAEAVYDNDEPLAKIYPHMHLIISAPIEIENLLPFDFNYRLYDKKYKKDWSGHIKKGVKRYVHVASLDSLLLLSVEPVECGFGKSEFAIINAEKDGVFGREDTIGLKRNDGQELKLKIYYPRKGSGSSSLKVVVYSPYVILNRTGQNVILNVYGNLTHSNGRSARLPIIPTMFSFDKNDNRRNRVQIKAGDSTWTQPISFDAIGQSSEARAQIVDRQLEMNIGISIAEGEGKYNLSKIVTLSPRYVLRNMLDEPLQVVESGSTTQLQIEPNELVPLYALRRLDHKNILLKFAHGSKTWSSAFCINDVGQLFVKVFKEGIGQILLKVYIFMENATIFIQIENGNNSWPFSIRNSSDADFYIYQSDPNVNEKGETVKSDTPYKPIYYKIPSRSVMPYAYDYPNAIIKELILRAHGRERVVNLAEIGNLKPFRLPPVDNAEQCIVDLNVVADGPTQSLIISNYDASVSIYKLPGEKSGSSMNVSQNFETIEKDDNYFRKIVTKFEGIGISLINTRSQELCYITLRGLEIRYNESDLYQNLSLKLKWIQVDNQLYGGIFPIVVYPSVIPKSGKELTNHPSLSASICKVKDDSHGVLFIKYATVLLQEMSIEIDEDFLFALLEFAKFPGASWNKLKVDKLCDDDLKIPEPKSFSSGEDIYFEALHLQPTVTNISFVRTERVNAEDRGSSENTLMFFFNVLTMAIGNINEAPIQLNSLFIENLRAPFPVLVESIQTHYGQEFFYKVHNILGSADILGNPVGLFKNLSSGAFDAFYEPFHGWSMTDRPQELGIEFAKGGASFLKKSVFGFSDSISKFTGSIAKGLTVVTMDKKFQERRRNLRKNKPKHALYGVAAGANSFVESISSGITGIATAPIEGAVSGGVEGFFKGLGKGVIGLPTKTAIGFFDLASNVTEGIKNTTTVFDTDALDKVRLSRYISHDGIMRPYSQREAQGQFWLKSIDGGIYLDEIYLAHLLLTGEEMAVIVTYKMIILFGVNNLTTKWTVKYDQIKAISKEGTGISIGLKRREGPFIPIPEKANRNFLYEKIVIAVGEFNKHCQVFL
ncbi:vacuolar sorting [Scheffersomyces coipomensis]|uniref:vacuolar sorting n=1 Tax=Scheffersomyces coipomensis TaxID=1788519 RepID=UPI00315DE37C